MDDLPDQLLDRIHSLRNRGWGPDRIFRELHEELAPRGISAKTLGNYIYSRSGTNPESAHSVQERLGRISDLLEKSGIDVCDVGKVKAVRLSEWQGLTKDADGEAQVHDLTGASIVLSPEWADGPKWVPVDRGPAIRLPRPPKPRSN